MLWNVCQSVVRFNLNVLGGMPWSRAVAVLVVAALVVVSGWAAPMAQAQTRGGGGSGGGCDDDILFDILGNTGNSTFPQAARKGGGSVPDFVLVNGVSSSQVMLLGESEVEGAYWVLVDMGDSIELGLMWANKSSQVIIVMRPQMKF